MLAVAGWRTLLSGGLGATGLICAVAAAYLATLAVSALFSRRNESHAPTFEARSTVVVLVPAYNEAGLIERCIASLRAQSYPQDRYEIVVVADNCTDDTAVLAERAGAAVMRRDEPDARGKGRALRWAMDQLLARDTPPDAIAVVDADSVAEPTMLAKLVRCFEDGADAVQGEYLVLPDPASARDDLRAAAFLLFHRVRFAGRLTLRLPCSLVGNGMLLSRRLLQEHPWGAFSKTEDLEYSIALRLAGVGPVFARGAIVRGPIAASGPAAQAQRARWEGGRLQLARTELPRLVHEIVVRRRWSMLDAVLDLATPPLGLLGAVALAGTILSGAAWLLGFVPAWSLGPWLGSLGATAGFVLIGLRAADAPRSLYRALLGAPAFALRKVLGTVAIVRASTHDVWIRTERPGESV